MELYPNIINIKKSDLIIKYLLLASVVVGLVCMLINSLTTPKINWSFIVVVSIVYVWITVMYSIKRNVNIAAHVMVQTMAVSMLLILLDFIIGYKGWSVLIGLPTVITAANLMMFVLAIVSRKKYFKYALYQMLLSLASGVVALLIVATSTHIVIPLSITVGIALFTLVMTIFLCGKDLKEELARFFHV